MEGVIKQQLLNLYPNIGLRWIRCPPSLCDSASFGVLLLATTSKGCILSAATMLDIYPEHKEDVLICEARHKGAQVVHELDEQLAHGGVVDTYLADQIIIFMAMATSGYKHSCKCDPSAEQNRCEILVGKVSLHTITAMKIAETVLTDIEFSTHDRDRGGLVIICERKRNGTTKCFVNSGS